MRRLTTDLGTLKPETMLQTIDLTKTYGETKENRIFALRKVNIKVIRGDFLSIMGPSGSGKSTLLNLLGGLDRPSRGKVLIDGSNLYKRSNTELATFRNTKLGFVFQAFNLITRMSILENVEAPLLVTDTPTWKIRKRALRGLRTLGIDGEKARRKPLEISGGEQQRVAVARALVTNPEIILADEPTGNLDSKNAEILMELLERLNKEGRTIVMVTHSPETSKMAKRTVYIRDGQVVGEEFN